MLLGYKLVFLILFLCHDPISTSFDCQPRAYGLGSVVCVCNRTYCDDIDPIKKSDVLNQAIEFDSSKDGDRFKKRYLSFKSGSSREYMIRATNQTVVIEVDSSIKYQSIIGFGAAFTDSFGKNLLALPENMQQMLLKSYFGEIGLEYNFGRIPIGGTDFSWRGYTYDDNQDDFDLSKFQLQPEDLKFKIPVIRRALDLAARKMHLFSSPWSPPAWIKTSDSLVGGKIRGIPGDMASGKYYHYWARYLVRFLLEYRSHGIPITGMTIQNEPFNNGINSLELNSTEEWLFIKTNLAWELEKHNFTKAHGFWLMIYDWSVYDFKQYAQKILNDPETRKLVSAFAVHDYWVEDPGPLLDWFHQTYPDQSVWMTETCYVLDHKPKARLGDWSLMVYYAQSIMKFFRHYSRAWTDWNLALNTRGGPNWFNNFVDAPIIVNANASEFYKQPSFYAIGHFSKFVPPGSFRIENRLIQPDQSVDPLLTAIAFQRPDNGIVLVILNNQNIPIGLNVKNDSVQVLKTIVQPQSIKTIVWFLE